jgi:hypothetical protein
MKNIAIVIPQSLLTRIRNNEHVGLLLNIDAAIEKNINKLTEAQPLYQSFHVVYVEEEKIYKRDAMAVETKYITDAHQVRRDAIRAVKLAIETASLGDEEKIRNAAILLKEVLHNYRSATSVPMNEVTPLVHNMIEDFNKPRYATAVTTLNLDGAISKLEEKNNAFNTIYVERTHSREAFDIQGTMKEIRPKADKVLADLVNGINTFYLTKRLSGKSDEDNPYADLIVSIDGLVEQVRINYEHRNPGAYKGKDRPDDEDTDTPAPTTPSLVISSQEVKDAEHMLLLAADQAAFDRALYPEALDGVVKFSSDEYSDYYTEFPILKFEVGSGKPIGLVLAPPQEGMVFKFPMNPLGEATGDVMKDGRLLATLRGFQWPEVYWK